MNHLNPEGIELNSKEFQNTVRYLLEIYAVDCIIETGTSIGTGSTMVFAKSGLPVVTLEIAEDKVLKARENLALFPNVTVLHASSLSYPEMLSALVDAVNRSYPSHVRMDIEDPANFYIHEIDNPVEFEGILGEVIDNTPHRKMVFLDSSGGIGYAEAKLVLNKCLGKPVVLVFDDANHMKHYHTVELVRSFGKDVNISGDGRFAWSFLG